MEYAAWLKARGVAHSPERLRRWVADDYRAEDMAREHPPLRPGARAQLARDAAAARR
jgi:hypothetical protein